MLRKKEIFFVQLGANDGVTADPLYKFVNEYAWRGVLLEPLPDVFETLKKNYRQSDRLKFLNAAISNEDGFRTLYTVRMENGVAEHATALSSFNRSVISQQVRWVPDIKERIEERQVRCISFETLLQEIGEVMK